MRITDVFNSKAIAIANQEAASNKIAYLGAGLFPAKKKMGLDLKWIKTSKGVPVTLSPSAFDTVSTIRSREGFEINETEMAFFKESMLVKEVDEQEILRVQEASDPYAQDVLARIYDDANNLIEGADAIVERMRMQLLSTLGGHPSISIAANGATYAYNYDPNNTYSTNNYVGLTGQSAWDDTTHSDPIADVMKAQDAVEARTGVRPSILIVSSKTMGYLKANANVRSYILAQNATANVIVTDARVKEIFLTELGVTIVVYNKMYRDSVGGAAQLFFPDEFATLVPNHPLGSTWYGTTPDERSLIGKEGFDTTIVNTGVAVTVTRTSDPVHTKTTVSEIVLPSFEAMDETYTIHAYTVSQD